MNLCASAPLREIFFVLGNSEEFMTEKHLFSMAKLAEMLAGELVNGADPDMRIGSVMGDSRQELPQSIFVAYRGAESDGHDYIGAAFDHGARAAVVTEVDRLEGRPGIAVADGKRALSLLAASFAGHPSQRLLTVGITGTNGKTTIHWIVSKTLTQLGLPNIRIGSLGIAADGLLERSGKVITKNAGEIILTTPGPLEIHQSMAAALALGVKACVLETSSHALEQGRVRDVAYDVAVFTNLTPDHLNYHPDLESYFQAKVGLFRQLAETRAAGMTPYGGSVVNLDCPYGRRLAELTASLELPSFTFGSDAAARVRILAFDQEFHQSRLVLGFDQGEYAITSPFIGDYNASNLCAAFAACLALGLEPQAVADAMGDVPPVPGRLEFVGNDRVAVFVDYAHTGEGLHKVLSAVKNFVKGDLWVVFGCGGGKDHRKRAAMAQAANALADKIVITSDNPKNEDPMEIIQDILSTPCHPTFVEPDRGLAIEKTLRLAQPGDVIILAGKGHEDYQIFGNQTFFFSDREEVLKHRQNGVF